MRFVALGRVEYCWLIHLGSCWRLFALVFKLIIFLIFRRVRWKYFPVVFSVSWWLFRGWFLPLYVFFRRSQLQFSNLFFSLKPNLLFFSFLFLVLLSFFFFLCLFSVLLGFFFFFDFLLVLFRFLLFALSFWFLPFSRLFLTFIVQYVHKLLQDLLVLAVNWHVHFLIVFFQSFLFMS